MKVEDLPAVELSGLCSAMSAGELVKVIILHSNWSWLTREKRNREKLTDFIMQSRWMDSRLLQLLAFSENPSSLDGEQLFLAAGKYALERNKKYDLCRSMPARIKPLGPLPPSFHVASDDAGNVNIAIDIDGERITVPPINHYFSGDYQFSPPPSTDQSFAKKEHYIYFLPVSMEPHVMEEAEFVKDPLWLRLNLEKIRRSHLVEICFRDEIVEEHETFFWNVVKSFASLMTSSQVLSIRVIYSSEVEEKEEEEVNTFLREMYAKVVRADITWLMDLPMKWTLYVTAEGLGALSQDVQWSCDLQA